MRIFPSKRKCRGGDKAAVDFVLVHFKNALVHGRTMAQELRGRQGAMYGSLRGAVVTIDAMDTQRTIAAKIVDADGHYILRLIERLAYKDSKVQRSTNPNRRLSATHRASGGVRILNGASV